MDSVLSHLPHIIKEKKMSLVIELYNLLKDYQNTSIELNKCSKLSKCSMTIKNKQDFFSIFRTDVQENALKKELNGLVELLATRMNIVLSSCTIESNKIFIKIFRPSFIKLLFIDIFNNQWTYGATTCHHGKVYRIIFSDCSHQLTQLRIEKVAEMLSCLITLGGGLVTDGNGKNEVITLHVTYSKDEKSSLLVSPVKAYPQKNMSKQEFIEIRIKDIQSMSNYKNLSEKAIMQLVDASIVFDLLSTKLEKNINLDVTKQPKAIREFNSRGASFVLYNYARLCSILEKFEMNVSKGIYQPLPSVNDINYSLLDDEDEWCLVFDILAEWPVIVVECQDLRQPKLHKITQFLTSLASRFSVYYRNTRILNEGFVHMFPLMEARLQLLLVIKQVFIIGFKTLGIIPPTTM